MKTLTLLCLLLLFAVPVSAQNAPGKFSTVTTTNTGVNSVSVGCSVGSTTCTGGVNAGSGAFVTGLTLIRGVNATHFAAIRNTTAGATAQTALNIGNDGSAAVGIFGAYSTTTTPVGTLFLADSVFMYSTGAGGLEIGSNNASGSLKFFTGGLLQRYGINAAGDWTFGPNAIIFDSNGTPGISACGTSPSISGTDSAFTFATGSTSTTSCTITFGHTFSGGVGPVCVASSSGGFVVTIGTQTVASTVTLTYAATTSLFGSVICRGHI